MSSEFTAAQVRGSDFGRLALRRAAERMPEADTETTGVALSLVRAAAAHLRESEGRIHRQLGLTWRAFETLYVIWIFGEVEARDLARFNGASRQNHLQRGLEFGA